MLKLLWECLTVWSVPPSHSLFEAQAILAHAAGENSPTDPGEVNSYNAELIKELYRRFGLPIIVQGELVPCLRDIPITAASPRQAETPRYLTSHDIAVWQKAECDKLGITKVILVSYLPHYWRALKCTDRVGLTVLVPEGLREMYDPHNSQWWVRFKILNRAYELLARLKFLKEGWI